MSIYDVFNRASKTFRDVAGLECVYKRGGVSHAVVAYWNAPAVEALSVAEITVIEDFREWYLRPVQLADLGIGEPKEFDRVIHDGVEWEVYGHNGRAVMRDGWPDIVVLTRRVKTGA